MKKCMYCNEELTEEQKEDDADYCSSYCEHEQYMYEISSYSSQLEEISILNCY